MIKGQCPLFYATTAYCHLVPSETNNLPVPVALEVVAIDPTGAVVVVLFAVIAVVKKYKPATALATAAVPDDVKLAPVTAPVAATVAEVIAPVAAIEAEVTAPDTVTLSNEGSAYATPVALVFGIIIKVLTNRKVSGFKLR